MVAPNDTSSTEQVTANENVNVLLAPPVSTKLVDIAQYIGRRHLDYANYRIQQRIGEYTVTCGRDFVPARAKYLCNEEALAHGMDVSYDLNQGFDAFMENERHVHERRQMDENNADERLDNFWKWIIMQAPKGSSVKEVLHDADIVCCRGLLQRIARTPYIRSAWEFSAIRFNNVVFLCEGELYTSKHNKSTNRLPQWYRDIKFDQYMTVNELNIHAELKASRPPGQDLCRVKDSTTAWWRITLFSLLEEEPKTDELGEKHVVVFRSTLGPDYAPLKLVCNGSIDAIKAGGKMVALKTRHYAHTINFTKDLVCYLQSFLMGITDTYVGYHNSEEIVTKVEHVPTRTFRMRHKFSLDKCMHLLSDVLNSIRSALQNDGEACKVLYAGNGSEVTIHSASLAEIDFFKNTNFREHFNLL